MGNLNKHAPCLDKNCSFCCDPVKINQRAIRNGLELPKDKNGIDLWNKREEIISPEGMEEKVRIVTFDCVNYDKETGRCLDYDSRPDLCRGTTCAKDEKEDIDKQHKELTEIKFTKLK